jgi:hypothetical protein
MREAPVSTIKPMPEPETYDDKDHMPYIVTWYNYDEGGTRSMFFIYKKLAMNFMARRRAVNKHQGFVLSKVFERYHGGEE